jgi:hypothetical protein
MELLSYLGTVPKRRKALEGRAEELLYGRSSVEAIEEEMRDRNLALVERLRRAKIRFTEFQRVAADETVTAALAGLLDDPELYEMLVDELGDYPDELIDGDLEGAMGVATWEGALGRMERFLVTPVYGFAASGAMLLAATSGMTMMRRVSRSDSRTCRDCLEYAGQGWVPIGTLPPPGQICACHDRCRCYVEYQ